MRSTEFLKEAPARYDDSGNELAPAPGTVGAAQADAARIAQGQKNLNAIKGFFGMKPEELKDAPPGFSIDPVQRARMGYKPATQQEIAAFQAANPNYGKLVDREGKPIKSGTPGVTWDAGGEKAVVQTAQAAAPETKGAAHIGMTPNVPTDVGRQPGAAHTGAAAYNIQTPAAAPAAPAAPADDSAARAAAAADRDRAAIKDLTRLADVPAPAAPAAAPEDSVAEPVVTAAELGSQSFPTTANSAAAAAEPAAGGGVRPQDVGPANTVPAQAATPAAKKAAPRVSPAVVGYASSMGLYKNGQPDPAAIKAFQKQQGLPADGIIGPNTSAAILSTAKPGMAGSGRGQQGGAPAPEQRTVTPTAPAQRGANTKAPTPVTPGKTPAPAVKESREIDRMRLLAGLSKD